MSVLHVLGSGAAFSDGERTTTMLALEGASGVVVVDCGGDVVQRLLAHGLDPLAVTALIVTHEHADHVGGLPLMMERLWLAGRRAPLPVVGIGPAVAQAVRLHDAFDTSAWPGYPGIAPRVVPHLRDALVLDDEDWRITASPGVHAVPVVGLRIEPKDGGAVVAYSCDTAYEPAIVELARGADLLLHEAAGGPLPIHATACEAARVAAEAGVGRLVLVHLPPDFAEGSADVALARERFPALEVGFDGARYPLDAERRS
ncbi:MAG: MBL fold metallo-hydrolase [Trueperaceae bacterium]|nr:MBL fold metallo-hydrolase [Trueperaceae bacterium]